MIFSAACERFCRRTRWTSGREAPAACQVYGVDSSLCTKQWQCISRDPPHQTSTRPRPVQTCRWMEWPWRVSAVDVGRDRPSLNSDSISQIPCILRNKERETDVSIFPPPTEDGRAGPIALFAIPPTTVCCLLITSNYHAITPVPKNARGLTTLDH